MKITSKEKLFALRKQNEGIIKLRESGTSKELGIQILVGMATCGIASGAKETYDEINELISKKQLKNISVVKVGCLGFCVKEPTLQVCKPGKVPVLYGYVTKDKAEKFLNEAVLKDGLEFDNQITMSFNKLVD